MLSFIGNITLIKMVQDDYLLSAQHKERSGFSSNPGIKVLELDFLIFNYEISKYPFSNRPLNIKTQQVVVTNLSLPISYAKLIGTA